MSPIDADDIVDRYRRDRFVVVADLFEAENNELEPNHSAERPRVRRIRTLLRQHLTFARAVRLRALLVLLRPLLGPAIQFDTSKLSVEVEKSGSPVEWHQGWARLPQPPATHQGSVYEKQRDAPSPYFPTTEGR